MTRVAALVRARGYIFQFRCHRCGEVNEVRKREEMVPASLLTDERRRAEIAEHELNAIYNRKEPRP